MNLGWVENVCSHSHPTETTSLTSILAKYLVSNSYKVSTLTCYTGSAFTRYLNRIFITLNYKPYLNLCCIFLFFCLMFFFKFLHGKNINTLEIQWLEPGLPRKFMEPRANYEFGALVYNISTVVCRLYCIL